MKRQVINKPAVAATIACPKPVTQISRSTSVSSIAVTSTRVAFEKPRRLEDDFGPGQNPERLYDDTVPAQRAPPCGLRERVPALFSKLGAANRNFSGCPRQRTAQMPRLEGGLHRLKADPSARADDDD